VLTNWRSKPVLCAGKERRNRVAASVIVAVLLALTGCNGGGKPRLVLDGSPRLPDAEGVVEQVSLERITLDGGRSYAVSKELASFSTYDLAPVPMLHRQGQYVQLGLDGTKVAWMAGIGVVVQLPGTAPVVFYNGYLVRVEGERAVFRDGTVLRLERGVESPRPSGQLRAEIDPEAHAVRALVLP
jgi:hypothetical protein